MGSLKRAVTTTFVLVGSILAARDSFAAPVFTAIGVDTTTQANWRSTNTAKTLDGDGNDVYGSAGYYTFATGNLNSYVVSPFSGSDQDGLPTWLTISANGANSHYSGNYAMIDDPTSMPGPTVDDINSGYAWRTGVAVNTTTSLYNLTFGAGTPSGTFRIGLFENAGGDAVVSYMLSSGDNSATQAYGAVTSPDFIHYAFIDVSNAAPGDVVTISGRISSNTAGGLLGLSGISIDAVPEPGATAVLAAAAMGAMVRRRRTCRRRVAVAGE